MTDLLAEPIVGWRAWRVQTGYRQLVNQDIREMRLMQQRGEDPLDHLLAYLQGYGIAAMWKGEPASCTPIWRGADKHPAALPVPAPACMCGYWAFNSREHLYERLVSVPFGIDLAFGRVMLWGRVIEHEKGWRAQYARPLDVTVVPPKEEGEKLIRDLRRRYPDVTFKAGPIPDEVLVLRKKAEEERAARAAAQASQVVISGSASTTSDASSTNAPGAWVLADIINTLWFFGRRTT